MLIRGYIVATPTYQQMDLPNALKWLDDEIQIGSLIVTQNQVKALMRSRCTPPMASALHSLGMSNREVCLINATTVEITLTEKGAQLLAAVIAAAQLKADGFAGKIHEATVAVESVIDAQDVPPHERLAGLTRLKRAVEATIETLPLNP